MFTGRQGYNGRIDNAENINDINTATKEGTAALNNLLDEQNLSGRRNQAIAAIQDAKDKVIATITNNKNLSDEEKTRYQELINTATDAGVAKISQDENETAIVTDEDNAIKNITGYQENAANTGATNLNKQRQDAIKEVEEAADNALSTINSFTDTDLSPEDKQHYKETINKDLANAKAAINAAKDKDSVNSARQAGKTSINEDLAAAQLIAAKSQANIALQDEKKKDLDTINQAFANNKINSAQKDALTGKINDFYETATSKVFNDSSAEQVAKDRDDGIAAMANIAGSIASEEAKYLEQQKDDALTNKDTGLNALAEKIRTSIEKDPNLSGKEKGDYYDEISSALTSAKTDIQNAHSQDEIATATNAGREALNKILAKVVLQSSRSAALKEMLNTYTNISNQITNLQNVNSTTKDGLIKQLTDYYNDAVAKVKNVPATQVDSEKQQGIDNMNTVIRDAQSLDTNIDHAKQEVDSQADQAISAINQSAMSDADKTQTIAKINDERTKAKQNIESQKSNDAVDQAKNDSKDAIGQVVAFAMATDLENAKHHSEEAINKAAQEAISRLTTSYNSLSAEEKADASSQYEQAITDINKAAADAKSKSQNSKTKDGINKITTDTINAINKAEASGNLAITKAQARKAIDDAYKQSYQDIESAVASADIPEDADIGQNIDSLLAKPETGTEPEWFNDEQNNALKGAEGVDGINDAFSKLKDKLKDKLSPELLDRIDEQIKAITNATDIQTTSAAYDEAMTIINKENAKADIDEKAAKVTAEIDSNDKLAAETKNRLKQQIKNDSQKAKDKIDAVNAPKGDTSKKKEQIEKIKDTAKADITSAGNAAKNESISSLRADANNELAAKYQKAVAELKEKFGENADTTNVDKAYHEHSQINGDSIEDITAAKIAAEKEIAKGSVADTAANAKNQVDKLKHQDGSDYTDTEKQAIKDYIDQKAAEVNNNHTGTIDQAQDSAGVEKARKEAVEQINNIIVADSKELDDILNSSITVLKERLKAAYDSSVKLLKDRFKDKADTTCIDKAYESAKDALNNSANADKLAATELTGEKEIAAGALVEAQKAATSEIQSSSKYTEQEKKAIINQIDADMTKANDTITQPEVNDSETIAKLRDDAIKQMYLNATDSATIDHILHDINHENDHSSISHFIPAPTDNKPVHTANKEENESKLDLTSSEELTLMHNAYLYDETGKRANKIILGAGSIITSYGIKEINGQSYYVLVDKGNKNKIYYVARGNVVPTSQKLRHNAYVYNKHGNRVKKAGVLKKGNDIKTYGNAVTIRGKKYYIIAQNRFVKAANIAFQKAASAAPINKIVTENAQLAAEKTIMHNSFLYDQNGKRANKLIILAGSIIKNINKQVINGQSFYKLEDGLYIAAANIDAKRLKLRHSAYVYSQHGNRISKKILRKQQVIKTYGSPVKINHEKYFIIAKNKFVKETNFK